MEDQIRESPFRAVAEAAWERQADHHRFRFEPRRADDHPSRVYWVSQNELWRAQRRQAKGKQKGASQ